MSYFVPEFRAKVAAQVAEILGVEQSLVRVDDAGEQFSADLAVPCFVFATQLSKPPQESAEKLAQELKFDEIENIESVGGYANITIKAAALLKALAADSNENKTYGGSDEGKGKKIVVDFIGLNLSKPFSVGHLRPTVQGWALIQIYKALGYEVIGDSHMGDWGTPFGMWVVGFEKWGSEEALIKDGAYELGRVYVKFREEAKNDENLIDEAKAWLKKLEDGDNQAKSYHERFNKISYDHAAAVLARLKIKADENLGESFYVEKSLALVNELVEKGEALKQDDGSVIVRLEEFGIETPALLLKGDGSILYLTSDLATIDYRIKTWDPEKVIYSVGGEQQFHFKQVFAVAKKLGWLEGREFVHPWFGTVDEMDDTGKRGKMSSRKNTALLEHLLDTAEVKAREIAKADGLSDDDIRAISVGAIKYNDFARPRTTNILFDWESMFSLNGHSAAYIQYAAVRVGSILSTLGEVEAKPSEKYDWQAEKELLMMLSLYPERVRSAAAAYEPFIIADYAYNLAKAWNRYYETTSVRGAEGEALNARVWLLQQLRTNFEHALGLLGIEVPGKM